MRRILVVNPFGIGDVLFMTPFLHCVREQTGVEFIDVLVGSRTRDILEGNPRIRKVYVMNWDKWRAQSKLKTFFEVANLLAELRKSRYDHYFDFSSTRTYVFFAKYVLGIPRRIGFDYKQRGAGLTDKVKLDEGYSSKHVIEYYLDLARCVGVNARPTAPEFFVKGHDRLEANRLLQGANISCHGKLIAVSPGGGASWGKDAFLKQWAPERFRELIRYCGRKLNIDGVIVLGSSNEETLAECLMDGLEYPVLNVAGKTTLGVSAALLECSSLLLANDGGMVHLARAVNCPCCAIFGPTSEVVYGPYPKDELFVTVSNDSATCRPCYKKFRYKSDCVQRICLDELNAERVTDILEREHLLDKIKVRLPKHILSRQKESLR